MMQEERWVTRYKDVLDFIETNHRNPSKHNPEERFQYYNWIKHNRQVLNSGEMLSIIKESVDDLYFEPYDKQ